MEGPREKRIIVDDLASYEEEIGISRGMKRKGKFSEFLKNIFVGCLLIGIVVGSFWVSFLIGKRVLVPVKTISTQDLTPIEDKILVVEEDIIATPVLASYEVEEKEEPAKMIIDKPEPPEVIKYYKVQAGLFENKIDADLLVSSMKVKGISSFIRKLSSGKFRVQAGAFRTKARASTLVNQLKGKGFESTIIFE